MRRILVSAVSGDIACGILKILKEQKDTALFGCDCNEYAAGMDYVEKYWRAPLAKDDQYIPFILDRCVREDIGYFIPVNEREIEKVSRHRELFAERNIKLVIQSKEILDICLNKSQTMDLLREHGLHVPLTLPNVRYVAKPNQSNGSKGLIIADVKKELGADYDSYIIQEYIEGDEYTLGVFQNGDVLNTIAFRRQLKNGYSYLVELVRDERLQKIAEKAAEILRLKGYINIQLRRSVTDGEFYIFEINPRISGTVRYRDMLGYRDVLWWLDLLDGLETPVYHCPYKKAVGIRELNEKFLVLDE